MRHALLALAAGAALAGPAAAQTPNPAADKADVRCLLMLQMISTDAAQKDAAVKGVFFYLGRLTARGEVARLEPLMLAEEKALSALPQAQAQTELTRCAGELGRHTQAYDELNKKLAAQVAKQQPPPPPKK